MEANNTLTVIGLGCGTASLPKLIPNCEKESFSSIESESDIGFASKLRRI